MIDASKPYRSREGHPARILCTDHDDPLYPVVAAVKTRPEFSMVFLYSADGRYEFGNDKPHGLDLVLAEE